MSKLKDKENVLDMVDSGSSVVIGGFVGFGHPECFTSSLEEKYLEEGVPNDLTLIFAAGQGDGKGKGLEHLAHEGMIKRFIGGHWGLVPSLGEMALNNEVEAYNFPQGVISHLFRDTAADKPGTITHVGLQTFIDPRKDGGKLNESTKEDLIELIEIQGEQKLLYKPFDIDYAIIRGTTADKEGNITMEKEALTLENLSIAQATKNCGGKVIVQVERMAQKNSLDPKSVQVPGILVDAVFVSEDGNHDQSFAEKYNPSFAGNIKEPEELKKPLPLNERKIIGRRAAMELTKGSIVNIGIGMPESISKVTAEEGVSDEMNLTVEAGPIGGSPAGGLNFGASKNPKAIIDQPYQFDYYDGGGLDLTFLGAAQIDRKGNVNVSKFGSKTTGVGGFVNISQNANKVIYCGTLTANNLELQTKNEELNIKNEGKIKKFVDQVEQVSFSGDYANQIDQEVLYITERAVFKLTDEGPKLTEIAPGIDLEKDILQQMKFKPVIKDDLKTMDPRIFRDQKMNLKIE